MIRTHTNLTLESQKYIKYGRKINKYNKKYKIMKGKMYKIYIRYVGSRKFVFFKINVNIRRGTGINNLNHFFFCRNTNILPLIEVFSFEVHRRNFLVDSVSIYFTIVPFPSIHGWLSRAWCCGQCCYNIIYGMLCLAPRTADHWKIYVDLRHKGNELFEDYLMTGE